MSIRVLIADDHKLFREGLRMLLEKEGIHVVGEAADGREAIALVAQVNPHVVVMDVSMPNMNGIETTHQINQSFPDVRIVGLSMHMEHHYIQDILHAGASGYVLKDCDGPELIQAIRHVAEGRGYLTPKVATAVVKDYVDGIPVKPDSPYVRLTKREREVLQLLSEGSSMKEIAALLFLSVKTVHTHRQNIMEKLGLHSVAELTRYAIREGLSQI